MSRVVRLFNSKGFYKKTELAHNVNYDARQLVLNFYKKYPTVQLIDLKEVLSFSSTTHRVESVMREDISDQREKASKRSRRRRRN